MIIGKTDFFKGIDTKVMNKITASYIAEVYPKDTVLFRKDEEGGPA